MSLSNKEILAFVKKNIDLKKVDGKIGIDVIKTDVGRVEGHVGKAGSARWVYGHVGEVGSVGRAERVGWVTGDVDRAASVRLVVGHVGRAGSVGSVSNEENES